MSKYFIYIKIKLLNYSCMTFLEKLKIKLQNFGKNNQLLLLDILDFLVDKGNMNIWSAISSKKFFQGLLNLLKTKDIPEVQMKLLGLIQKWGLNFEDKKNALPNFFSVYNKLRMNNVQFPTNFESNYQVYIDENNINKNNEQNNSGNEDNNDNNSDKDDDEIFYYMDSLKEVLKVPNFEHKYRRLVNFLVKMHDNIQMANLLIDNREHGGLKEIINTLREGNNTLIDTIQGGRLKDEKLMEITLGTTEDINQTLGRDEDIKNGYKPNKFKSYFVMNNVIRIKNNNHNHRNRAKSTRPKKNVQRNQEKYGIEDNFYDKNKYKEKMGPKNADDIFDLFSASNPNNEPQYFQNNNNRMNNNNSNNINNFFNSPQTQQLRNNPMNNFFNNSNRNNNMNNRNNNNNNNPNMFFNQNNNQYNNQQRPVMTNFDILEQKLNNLNLQQNQNNNYNNNYNFNNVNNNQNMPNNQFNQGFNNNNNNINNNNNRNNNNLMSMLDQLGPGPQTNSNQLVPYIGSFNNQNNNMNQNNNYMNNNQYNNGNNNQYNNMNNNQYNNMNNQFNNMNNNNNNQYNNSNNNNNQFNNMNNNNQYNNRNMYNSQIINRGNNNMQINNDNQMNMNRMNMSQNVNNNNWMSQNNNQNNQQNNFEEMQKPQRLKELDDLF